MAFKSLRNVCLSILFLACTTTDPVCLLAQSFDLPGGNSGISFGNSKSFSGIRFNYRDHDVERISGFNFTLWRSYNNEYAVVKGISVGVIPEAGTLKGIQFGIAGVAANRELTGFSAGLLGAGAGEVVSGIAIGGLGVGSGNSLSGIFAGGLGVGSGGDMSGVAIGGLGTGAGRTFSGFGFAVLAVGAGQDLRGVHIGGLAVGAGQDFTGIGISALAVGAGNDLKGIHIGGLAVGCGNKLSGITFAGLAAGAPVIKGFTVGGVGVGGNSINGVSLAVATIRVEEEGELNGFAFSAFNFVRGTQTGLSIGIVNYAHQLRGVQIGLVNYVRDNPGLTKILPIININL